MKVLITGGCGFLGSNLASYALKNKMELYVFDNLYRDGASANLKWLRSQGNFSFIFGDIRNYNDVVNCVKLLKPDLVFHLSGQVAMTTSIMNPRLDFETNAVGTHNLLEAVRLFSPASIIIYSSTNKVYGDLEQYTYSEQETRYKCLECPQGFDESTLLEFYSPYGCSKGSADQYILDYSRVFGLKTIVFRHSSMYGGRQFATYDQGWIGWFCQKALEAQKGISKAPFTISGNGKQVRDVLYASDVVELYFLAAEKIDVAIGQAFNVGGGFENSLSLLELFDILEDYLSIELKYTELDWRLGDQKVFIADLTKTKKVIGWEPKINKFDGIAKMLDWMTKMKTK